MAQDDSWYTLTLELQVPIDTLMLQVQYTYVRLFVYVHVTFIGYYPGKCVTSVLLHEEWMYARGKAEGNKTDVTRFPG